MPPGVEEITKWGPPYLALYLLIWAIWKAGRWVARRFFDESDGLITGWFHGQQKLFAEQSDATKAITESIQSTNGAVEAVQRRLEKAIASGTSPSEQQHLIDILLDDTPVPMALVLEDGSFMRTNEAFQNLLGYSQAELHEMNWKDVTPDPKDVTVDAATCATIALGHSPGDRIEKTYRRRDGTTLYCALYIRRFPRVGPFRHFVSVIVPLHPDRQLR